MKSKIITALFLSIVATSLLVTVSSCSNDDHLTREVDGWPFPKCLHMMKIVNADNNETGSLERVIHPDGGTFTFKLCSGNVDLFRKVFPKVDMTLLENQINDFYFNWHVEYMETIGGEVILPTQTSDRTWEFAEQGIKVEKIIKGETVYIRLTVPPMKDDGSGTTKFDFYFAAKHDNCTDSNCPLCSVYTDSAIEFEQVNPTTWSLIPDSDKEMFYTNTHVDMDN